MGLRFYDGFEERTNGAKRFLSVSEIGPRVLKNFARKLLPFTINVNSFKWWQIDKPSCLEFLWHSCCNKCDPIGVCYVLTRHDVNVWLIIGTGKWLAQLSWLWQHHQQWTQQQTILELDLCVIFHHHNSTIMYHSRAQWDIPLTMAL